METKIHVALCALVILCLGSNAKAQTSSPGSSNLTTLSTGSEHNSSRSTDRPGTSNSTTPQSKTASASAQTSFSGSSTLTTLSTGSEHNSSRSTDRPGTSNSTTPQSKTASASATRQTQTFSFTTHPVQNASTIHTTSSKIQTGASNITVIPLQMSVFPNNTSSNVTASPMSETTRTTQPSLNHSRNPETSNPTQTTLPLHEQHTATSNTSSANSTSSQTKTLVGNPSQLNVANAGQPALDPLLAGLVSAFIVTAAIIALLLFLKLRRQNQRPEFRRLQELPMDDMEDTPLSMYSY
ncbi:hypothetical protein UPYG_G00028890 [Umbra pygmaea]|uniref:Uncharacterized protein n=1 Tax=Umbra pygmaea TaxID=75934 RepID=A0ABD0XPC2_UMBPY